MGLTSLTKEGASARAAGSEPSSRQATVRQVRDTDRTSPAGGDDGGRERPSGVGTVIVAGGGGAGNRRRVARSGFTPRSLGGIPTGHNGGDHARDELFGLLSAVSPAGRVRRQEGDLSAVPP